MAFLLEKRSCHMLVTKNVVTRGRSDCRREGAGGEAGEVAEVFGGDTGSERHAQADSEDVWRVGGRPGGKRLRKGSAGRRREIQGKSKTYHGGRRHGERQNPKPLKHRGNGGK